MSTRPVSIVQQHSIYEFLVKLSQLVNQVEVPDKTS